MKIPGRKIISGLQSMTSPSSAGQVASAGKAGSPTGLGAAANAHVSGPAGSVFNALSNLAQAGAKGLQGAGAQTLVNVSAAIVSSTASTAAAATAAGGGAVSAATQAMQQIGVASGKLVSDTIGHVQKGALDAAKTTWEGLGDAFKKADVNGLIQWVLKESYGEATKDLRFFAEKVQHFNEQKSAIREKISQARQGPSEPASPGGLAGQISKFEEKLQGVSEDAQLANIDLQNALQKSQQTLQTMSNVSKMLHDTAMAVVRKIG